MPATEQTWRNQKAMHVVFAVATLIMVLATVWMASADHKREWKTWQLKDRKKEAWMLASRRDSLADQYQTQMDAYQSDRRRARSEPIDVELVDQFKTAVVLEDARLATKREGVDIETVDPPAVEAAMDDDQFDELNGRLERFNHAAEIAVQRRADVAAAGDVATAEQRQLAKIAEDGAIKLRMRLMGDFESFINEARRREDILVGRKKTLNGERTAAVSEKGIAVHQGASQRQLDAIQHRIDMLDQQIDQLTFEIAAANDYRRALENTVGQINAEQDELDKALTAMRTELDRLHEQVSRNTTNPLEWMTRLPVLDALYDGNVRVDQLWLPDLTIDYNFSDVARFDRCTTCHRGIAATKPGTATEPAYPTIPDEQREFTVQLPLPEEQPKKGALLRDVYGLVLAESGVVEPDAVTVRYTVPESAAARAGLLTGDVIQSVGSMPVYSPAAVRDLLVDAIDLQRGEAIPIDVLRGLDHPFSTHPRLDLYLTDLSPHPMKTFGCTICHDGQGSGTEFLWASHTPNDDQQLKDWIAEYGWFDNHHWIFPMKPERFEESNCLKCHFDKGGLEPSERFPDPPAPKLVEGWSLVEDYGCFGCHEIGGYAGGGDRIGPDVRLEPNFHEAAAQILRDDGLTEQQRDWAQRLSRRPDDAQARANLMASINKDKSLSQDPETRDEAQLSLETHNVMALLKGVDFPGQYRKVGPSLRRIQSKVQFDWLYSWIRKPSDFRPTTKMPQFFLQYEHLQQPEDAHELLESTRFEPIEIYALSWFLLENSSDDFEMIEPPEKVTAEPSAERGRWLFESRGCLACHSHKDFPSVTADQGPDLSRLSAKLGNEKGRKWLYTWLKQPNSYHTRTVMPDLYLDPIAVEDEQGNPTDEFTDPAADIAQFLLGVETDWTPEEEFSGDPSELSETQQDALADLALSWLASDAIPEERAKRYLVEGIPERLAPRLNADERLLVGMTEENRSQRQLEFVARRTISKYGCFGCHDIPGFEAAKPIGTALADWGRKETSKLAFENIETFLATHGLHPTNSLLDEGPWATPGGAANDGGDHGAQHHLDPGASKYSSDESYFVQAITSHSRDGFLWQKLRYPRSFDYKTTENKGFNERLRMPRFPFTDQQREAVMTFVLGLVNEPPAEQYIYQPNARQEAIVQGRKVLERFNCAGCHVLDMQRWKIAYNERTFESPIHEPDFPFLEPNFTAAEVAASLAKDDRGMMHAELYGMPQRDQTTGEPFWVDEDQTPITREELLEYEAEEGEEIPIFYPFQLWRNVLLNGEPRLVYFDRPLVPADRDEYGPEHGTAYPAHGGDLAWYLFPRVIERAKEANPAADGTQAWGWLPPFLMDEGDKVQPDWLHGFLMAPTKIRPAAVMRMPNFHMSSDEAAILTDYFAAKSGAEFPYEYMPEQTVDFLAEIRQERETPLAEAMNIVVSGIYCVKCHGVAGFEPQGDQSTFGPNLADAYRRLRPKYMRDWIANPPRILPYTGMPKNIPYVPTADHLGGVSQQLFHGTSIEQVDGLVNLLMNFDQYAKDQTAVAELVQEAAAQDPASAEGSGEGEAQTAVEGEAAASDVLP